MSATDATLAGPAIALGGHRRHAPYPTLAPTFDDRLQPAISPHLYLFVCLLVCQFDSERDRDRERERHTQRQRDREDGSVVDVERLKRVEFRPPEESEHAPREREREREGEGERGRERKERGNRRRRRYYPTTSRF